METSERRSAIKLDEEKIGKRLREVSDLTINLELSSEELMEAYTLALSGETLPEDQEKLTKMVSLMKHLFDDGMPLNRISDLIHQYKTTEGLGFNSVLGMITELAVKDSEKRVLNGILCGKMIGLLIIKDVESDEILLRADVKEKLNGDDAKNLSTVIGRVLQQFGHKKLEVTLEN